VAEVEKLNGSGTGSEGSLQPHGEACIPSWSPLLSPEIFSAVDAFGFVGTRRFCLKMKIRAKSSLRLLAKHYFW
jgi:hypothetical protein